MDLHAIDLSLIVLYLVAVSAFGFVMRRKAGVNLESHFLGNRKVPWYFLGISNASSMFDIAGTMWLVSVVFIYGAKGAWLPWLWPTYNQVFLMAYTSAESIASLTPDGGKSLSLGRELDLDWSGLLPQLNDIIHLQGYELFLPHVISELVPIGLKGLIIVGFLAAFMSTFDSTINSSPPFSSSR